MSQAGGRPFARIMSTLKEQNGASTEPTAKDQQRKLIWDASFLNKIRGQPSYIVAFEPSGSSHRHDSRRPERALVPLQRSKVHASIQSPVNHGSTYMRSAAKGLCRRTSGGTRRTDMTWTLHTSQTTSLLWVFPARGAEVILYKPTSASLPGYGAAQMCLTGMHVCLFGA